MGTTARRGGNAVATVLRVVGTTIVAVLVLHVVLTLFEANPDNDLTRFVRTAADAVDLGLDDLFLPDDPKLAVAANHGTAAAIWFVLTAVVVRLARRAG